ncbi:MAG: hypothetical protein ACFE9R_03185, partial [Candidatus Hermodarchaeota archaeon]
MDDIREILNRLLKKECSIEEAEKLLKATTIEEVGEFAKLDLFRKHRTGILEVIYAENKTPKVMLEIIRSFIEKNKFAIISRYTEEQKTLILTEFENVNEFEVISHELAKIIILKEKRFQFEKKGGIVGIITAGSSDIPVAEEAKVIAESMGCRVISSYDLGIAGIHRIFNP